MANKNKYYTKEKEINGVKYVAQFNGMSQLYDMINATRMVVDGVVTSDAKKVNEFILENVIVEPAHLTIDDFEDFEEMQEVINFGSNVMRGKFRNKDEKSAKAGRSE